MRQKLLVFFIIVLLTGVTSVRAGPSIFLYLADSTGTYVGGTGWEAGYVIYGSGEYSLGLYAVGGSPNAHWPIHPVWIVIVVSDEAASGGLESITIDGMPVSSPWIPGGWSTEDFNLPDGGPFSEPDCYGYNASYQVPGGLTITDGSRTNPKFMTVAVTFSASATEDSKIALLAYGYSDKGDLCKTPFSSELTFIVPELGTLVLMLGSFAALSLYTFKRKKN